jgi:hypothetical protein
MGTLLADAPLAARSPLNSKEMAMSKSGQRPGKADQGGQRRADDSKTASSDAAASPAGGQASPSKGKGAGADKKPAHSKRS